LIIKYIKGNIFNTKCEAIVNPVNCVGVMGAGLAKQFKDRYPDNFISYQYECFYNKKVFPGKVFVFTQSVFDNLPDKIKFGYSYTNNYKYIINFPTKLDWRDKSEIIYIDKGLYDLQDICIYYKIKSIAMPKLGCGLGGLDWKDVKELIEKHFSTSNILVECYV
jgi:O-acetyl-ADP-ribose deacetylase (regulator of RNase III)